MGPELSASSERITQVLALWSELANSKERSIQLQCLAFLEQVIEMQPSVLSIQLSYSLYLPPIDVLIVNSFFPLQLTINLIVISFFFMISHFHKFNEDL